MGQNKAPVSGRFAIEATEGGCDPSGAQLWKELHGPSCAATHPIVCLIARDQDSQRLLGIAQYFRTFPPEDGCGAVLLTPEARHTDVGESLLWGMLEHAGESGIRTLATVVEADDLTTMELLRQARLPVRVTPSNGRLYVEIDALHSLTGTAAASAKHHTMPGRQVGTEKNRGKEMEAKETLQTEHNAVLYVLDELDRASAAAAQGKQVPEDVFVDMEEFFRVFVAHCHHAKEESEVFPKLGAYQELTSTLEAQHREGLKLEQAYAEAVRAYSPGTAQAGIRLQESAQAYAGYLRKHIDKETQELFPAMERELQDSDSGMVAAFERVEVEQIGEGVHERLHGMIDGLAGRIDPWSSQTRAGVA